MRCYEDIERWLLLRIAALTESSPDDLDIDTAFADFALDSSVAVTMAEEIGRLVGAAQSPTLFWEYPTIRVLATELSGGGAG